MNQSQTPKHLPRVSVLAPCRNEAAFIRGTLQTILDNDYPPELVEILVLDGMSTDGTRESIEKMARIDDRIRLIDNPQKIVPTAMNIGIKEAKGEYLIRIDCHAKFPKNYVRKCIEVAQRTGAANVGGYWETLPGDNTRMARAIVLATSSPFGVGNSAFRTKPKAEGKADTVPFGTFKKSLFEEIGLFDERLVRNQDIEMNSRIQKSGQSIIISPEISLGYYNRATLKGLGQQSFNNGLWNPYTIWLTGASLRIRHFIPLFFVLGLVSMAIGSLFSPIIGMGLVCSLTIYAMCGLWAAIKQRPQDNQTSAARILAAFFVLHFIYGLGSVVGVLTIPLKFPRRAEQDVGQALQDRWD